LEGPIFRRELHFLNYILLVQKGEIVLWLFDKIIWKAKKVKKVRNERR